MTPSEREDLLGLHFEGAPDGRLDEPLDDPAARARFRGLAQVHGLLLARETEGDLRPRVMEALALEERRRALTGRVMATLHRRAPRPAARPWLPLLAAAGILLGIAIAAAVVASRPERRVAAPPPVAAPRPPVVNPVAREDRPAPEPPRPEPAREMPAPRKPAPPTAPRSDPEPPAAVLPPPKEEPPPAPKPAPEKPTVEAARYKPLVLVEIQGTLLRRREAKTEPVAPGADLLRTDRLATSHRRAARFATDSGWTAFLEKGTSIASELRDDGSVLVTLEAGAAFFEVGKRPAPFVVATPDGEVRVTGTRFLVERDARRTQVAVLEGSVRFRNEKGEAAVGPGQRSSARVSERPAAPARADVEALASWRRAPELSPNPERRPYSDHESGRRLPGLAVAAPFFEGEPEAGRLARATAEALDAGLALGHHWRDVEKGIWVNVDRGMEAELQGGAPVREAFTDRARKATADYLDECRRAAGVREAVPMIAQFRTHYVADLDVAEVAWSGWSRAAILQAKAFYAHLLEKHRPAARLELRFQGPDDTYDHKGRKRTFFHAEADARIEGVLAPRNARNAVVFFFPPGFGKDPDPYARILAELLEFLYARRR